MTFQDLSAKLGDDVDADYRSAYRAGFNAARNSCRLEFLRVLKADFGFPNSNYWADMRALVRKMLGESPDDV